MTCYLKLSPLSFKDLSAPKVWVRQLILLISPLEMLVSFTCGIPPWPLNIHYISFPRSYSSSCNFLLHVFFPIEGFIRFRIHFNVQHISFTLVFLLKLVYFHRKHISNSTFLSYIWRAASFWRNTMITSLSGLYQNSWASRTVRFLLPVIKSRVNVCASVRSGYVFPLAWVLGFVSLLVTQNTTLFFETLRVSDWSPHGRNVVFLGASMWSHCPENLDLLRLYFSLLVNSPAKWWWSFAFLGPCWSSPGACLELWY